MNAEEAEHTIATLLAENAALKSQIDDLEQHAGRHDCAVDLCDIDYARDANRCLLRPCAPGACWEAES